MPEVTAEIHGLAELKAQLRRLGPELATRIMEAGLSAAAEIIAGALREKTPVRTGELRDSIITGVEISPDGTSGIAKAGFGDKSYIARFVEYGHAKVLHNGERVGHVPAKPFAREASEESKQAAADAIIATAKAELSKLHHG